MDCKKFLSLQEVYRCISNFDNFQVCWAILPADVWGVINGYVSGVLSGDGLLYRLSYLGSLRPF